MWFVLLEFGNVAKHTFVDKVFGGVFISSVLCHVCHMVCIFCLTFSLFSVDFSETGYTLSLLITYHN